MPGPPRRPMHRHGRRSASRAVTAKQSPPVVSGRWFHEGGRSFGGVTVGPTTQTATIVAGRTCKKQTRNWPALRLRRAQAARFTAPSSTPAHGSFDRNWSLSRAHRRRERHRCSCRAQYAGASAGVVMPTAAHTPARVSVAVSLRPATAKRATAPIRSASPINAAARKRSDQEGRVLRPSSSRPRRPSGRPWLPVVGSTSRTSRYAPARRAAPGRSGTITRSIQAFSAASILAWTRPPVEAAAASASRPPPGPRSRFLAPSPRRRRG